MNPLARHFIFLSSIFIESKRTFPAVSFILVRLFIFIKLFPLRIDQSIHRINNYCYCLVGARIGMPEDIVKNSGHKSPGFTRTSTRCNNELFILTSKFNRFLLMPVKPIFKK